MATPGHVWLKEIIEGKKYKKISGSEEVVIVFTAFFPRREELKIEAV